MGTIIGADTAKLAGLQIDLLQKIRSGQVSLEHLEWFNKLTRGKRDRLYRLYSGATVGESCIVIIDRTMPFDPAAFIGTDWDIWRGPVDGNGLKGNEDQDERSLALNQVDLANVRLEHMLENDESWIKGEEKLARLKKAHIRLDAKVFQALWKDRKLIPESWKEKINGDTRYVFFDGTVLRHPGGDRCVLYLYWRDGQWDWGYGWLKHGWDVSNPSAVLASI